MKNFKKLLLSSSAIVGTAFLANTANAGTIMVKDDLQVKMSGFVAFQAGIYDNDDTTYTGQANKDYSNNHEFRTKVEVEFAASNQADNGLRYGAQIRLQDTASFSSSESVMKVKEAKVWMSGDWGHLDFGDDHGPIQKMDYRAPTVGIGQIDGDFGDYLGPLGKGQIGLHALNSERSTKIAYYTPRFNFFSDVEGNGLQLGASYAPEFNSRGRNVMRSAFIGDDYSSTHTKNIKLKLDANQKHWFELGANYIHTFGPVEARIFGGYSFAEAKKVVVGTHAVEDVRSWQAGGQLAYAGFTFGGAYVDAKDSGQVKHNNTDKCAWNLGLTYENGPWGFGISYLDEDLGKKGKAVAGGDYHLVAAGVNYILAPGLSLAADIGYFERDFEATGFKSGNEELKTNKKENDGWVAILQTRVDF